MTTTRRARYLLGILTLSFNSLLGLIIYSPTLAQVQTEGQRIPQDPTLALRADNIRLRADLYDDLLVYTNGEKPLAILLAQSTMINDAMRLVVAHGDSALVAKFKAIGFPVNKQ